MPLRGWEFLIVVLVVLIVFGVGKLPQTLGSLGKGIHSFRKAASGENIDTEIFKSKSDKEEPTKEKDTTREENS
jgi:sec-independent protein translocase protein TatA